MKAWIVSPGEEGYSEYIFTEKDLGSTWEEDAVSYATDKLQELYDNTQPDEDCIIEVTMERRDLRQNEIDDLNN